MGAQVNNKIGWNSIKKKDHLWATWGLKYVILESFTFYSIFFLQHSKHNYYIKHITNLSEKLIYTQEKFDWETIIILERHYCVCWLSGTILYIGSNIGLLVITLIGGYSLIKGKLNVTYQGFEIFHFVSTLWGPGTRQRPSSWMREPTTDN